jgi:DNA-binding GntR family transcriptional regulator
MQRMSVSHTLAASASKISPATLARWREHLTALKAATARGDHRAAAAWRTHRAAIAARCRWGLAPIKKIP